MAFYTYILQSEKSGRFYIGHTYDLDFRVDYHNTGRVPSTANKGPWTLVYFETYETRSAANSREMEIKRKKSRKYILWLLSDRPD